MLMEEKPNKKNKNSKQQDKNLALLLLMQVGEFEDQKDCEEDMGVVDSRASGINVLFFRLLSQTRSRQTYRQTAVVAGGCSFFFLRACVQLLFLPCLSKKLCNSVLFSFLFLGSCRAFGCCLLPCLLDQFVSLRAFQLLLFVFPNALICCNLFFLSCVLAYAIQTLSNEH